MMSDANPNEKRPAGAETPAVNTGPPPPAAEPDANGTPPESKPAGFCRICGKALEAAEVHQVAGVLYCAEHVPAPPPSSQGAPPRSDSEWAATASPRVVDTSISPGLAFVLGLIPGVGAIYNGQYAKGLVHVVIFGLLISILDAGAGGLTVLFSLLLPCWVFYMAFEAYHTAKKRQAGEPVDEFSSLVPMSSRTTSKVGPVILIAGGALFLLINLDIIELYRIVKFWPVLLIALGAWMLYARRGAAGREE